MTKRDTKVLQMRLNQEQTKTGSGARQGEEDEGREHMSQEREPDGWRPDAHAVGPLLPMVQPEKRRREVR